MTISVSGFSYRTTSDDLQAAFEQFGTVASAKVIYDKDTGRTKGFGLVEMDDYDEACDAIMTLDGSKINDGRISVKEARPKQNHRHIRPSWD